MTKVSELVDYISIQSIEKAAALLITIWVLSPIIIMLYSITIKDMDQSCLIFKQYPASIYWYEILQTIGFLGCILGIIIFSKSILNVKAKKLPVKQYIKNNVFILFLFFMLIWSILSCLASDNIDISLNGTLYRKDGLFTYFTYCGIFCCGYIIRNKKFMKCILEFFTISATVLSILMLINSENLNNLFGLTSDSSVFYQFNHFAYYLCMALMCALLLFETEKNSTLRLIFRIVIFAMITAALVKNGSLGPYLAVVVGLILSIILAMFLDKKIIKRILIAASVFIGITLSMNISNNHTYKDFKILEGDIYKIAENSADAGEAGTGRWILWMNGLRFISERPLLGYGPDNLGEQYAKVNIETDRAHNEIIQFAASLGIPAAIFYIIAIINYFIVFIRKRNQVSTIEIGMLCTVTAYLASSMFGNTMYYTSPFFFMLLGISSGRQKLLASKSVVQLPPID
jgi:O-antigen ligase